MLIKRVLVLVVAAVLVAGCSGSGSDDEDSSSTTDAATDTATDTAAEGQGGEDDRDGAFAPVTIEHRYGETEITERPERIVSLDTQWTDVLTALDAPPIGHLVDPTQGGAYPWQTDLGDSTELTVSGNTIPDEQILELQPDLIVVSYLVEDEAAYEDLSRLAPVITTLSDSQVDTWQEIAGAAGQVIGDTDGAAALVEEGEGAMAAVAEELPGLEGKTFTFANYVPGDAMYVLSDPDDGANVFFGLLGLEIAPAILDAEDASPGRVTLSLEQIELLDADLVMVLTNGADTDDIPAFNDLPAVQDGAVAVMDFEMAVALNTPTPLSLPYAIEELRPALEAAAG